MHTVSKYEYSFKFITKKEFFLYTSESHYPTSLFVWIVMKRNSVILLVQVRNLYIDLGRVQI